MQRNPVALLSELGEMQEIIHSFQSTEEVNAAEIRLSLRRHDHHSLEVTTNYAPSSLQASTELEFFLFLPQSVNLKACSKSDIYSDIRLRARYSTPPQSIANHSDFEALLDHLRKLRTAEHCGNGGELPEASVAALKSVIVTASESVKRSLEIQRRKIFVLHSLIATQTSSETLIEDIKNEMVRCLGWIERVANVLGFDELGTNPPLFGLAEEYLSFVFVQYLGDLKKEMGKFEQKSPSKGEDNRKAFDRAIREVLKSSQNFHQSISRSYTKLLESSQPDELERYLARMSQLKKFFQSAAYAEVEKQHTAKKIAEPVAALGATASGVVTAGIEFFKNPDWVSVGFRTAFLVSFGVAIYVLRDRIKDQAKIFFMKKVESVLPDSVHRLSVNHRPFGAVKEWLGIKSSRTLGNETRNLRYRNALTAVESYIPEDVIHYRKRLEVDKDARRDTSLQLSLNENLRLNIERFLKNLDDPMKEHAILTPSGKLSTVKTHRVYYFHALLHLREWNGRAASSARADREQTALYRIAVDKNGIGAIQPV